MIGIPEVGSLEKVVMSGKVGEGLTITTAEGKPAQLAVVDEEGRVIESGPQVAREAWNVTLATYKNFRMAQGYYRVLTGPPSKP